MEIIKFLNNMSELNALPMGLLLIAFTVIIASLAVKILRFDISDFIEKRHQRELAKWRRRAQAFCPHCIFWIVDDSENGRFQLYVDATFVSPFGTAQIKCERCHIVFDSWAIIHAMFPYLPDRGGFIGELNSAEAQTLIDLLQRKEEEFRRCAKKLSE